LTTVISGTTALKADKITYHPGDTAAPHYHRDCEHVFIVLEGRGTLLVEGDRHEISAGDVALVEADEVHHFENPYDASFSFIELWVPAPADTVWVDPDDT
jgi:quercetin dioxygenase-like cupin family protein